MHPFIDDILVFKFAEAKKPVRTKRRSMRVDAHAVPVFINEFWTSRQRQAHSLHEVSYRACFKPQLPRFFIERLTKEGERVYDPFSGRGTTVIEAALCGRTIAANDVNPLSAILSRSRLGVPTIAQIEERLKKIPMRRGLRSDNPLSMFFHRDTLSELLSLKKYLQRRAKSGTEDDVDRWIRMVATNRLTGHSKGFFSVYTLPPNQAASPEAQRRINALRGQRPPYRDVKAIILRKSRQLQKDVADESKRLRSASRSGLFITGDARSTPGLKSGSIALTVTSPPFLDIVQYSKDNWLRCWFNGIDAERIERGITMSRTTEEWDSVMTDVFRELFRVTKNEGWVAFEVGEVRNGTVLLEKHVVRCGTAAGFQCEGIMVHQQRFTKTANIWGVKNNAAGTNSHRIVLFRKSAR